MNYLERAYPWLLLAPVFLPVIIWGGLISPYLVPKTLLFYAISSLSVGVFVILAANGRAFYYARLSYWETWIPALLILLAYGTSFIGIDFYKSFWSMFVRGDGLLMLSCAVASFYLILVYTDRAFFARLLCAVAVVGSAVALYGIGEWLLGGGRIGSLFGNAAFFAGYLGISLFATLLAAGLVYGAYGVFYGKGKARTISTSVLVGLVLVGGLFFAFRTTLAQIPFEPIARIASISLSDGTVSSRLFIWEHMLTEIQKSPWSGVGAEHIDVLFNRFYDPTQIVEQWFDRSHNAFLDYTAQYGIGGLLLYLALIAAFFTSALRLVRKNEAWIG